MNSRARIADPATSQAAGAAAAAFICDHHAKIIAALEVGGPGTIYEVEARTGIDHVAVARRMKELEMQKLVLRTGDTRPSPLGRQCTVWEFWSLV
jgi:predicted transcriptional regulator